MGALYPLLRLDKVVAGSGGFCVSDEVATCSTTGLQYLFHFWGLVYIKRKDMVVIFYPSRSPLCGVVSIEINVSISDLRVPPVVKKVKNSFCTTGQTIEHVLYREP